MACSLQPSFAHSRTLESVNHNPVIRKDPTQPPGIGRLLVVETRIVHLRARGTLTLPARWRQRYGLREGDPLTLVDLDGVLVLTPLLGDVGKLAGEIERLRERAELPVEDLVAGVEQQRGNEP